ncbi:MAG TPA: DUF3761 domain-containing protein [Gemmatimonadaceae bacterium]|jgi:hypothetical protein
MLRNFSVRALVIACAFALAPLALQAQATTCKDGTTSTASGKGACSGHGGVGKAAAKAAKAESKANTKVAKTDAKVAKSESKAASKATKTTDAAGATAKCKDGTYSRAATRRGACSRHGGVAEWLKT